MKRFFVVVSIFIMGGAAAFAYLYKREKISPVSATSQIWTENQPLITSNATSTPTDIFEKIAEKFKPTVVNIHTTQTIKTISPFQQFRGGPDDDFFRRFFDDFFGQIPNLPKDFKQKNLGSGFIISSDGYIITNHHVIDKADEVKVKLSDTDKETFDAKIIGSDHFTDIALIKIDPKGKNLPVAPLGDSDKIRAGQWVAAIGHPFGYGHTVTHGIISAKERLLGNGVTHPYNDYIQTDASINLGNSGGPLISTEGEVVGINVATDARAQGVIGFAIPINVAKDLMPQLIKTGHAIRGFIGIVWHELTEELAQYLKLKKGQQGIVISEIIKGNPADLAGLKIYDVIIEFNGAPIRSGRELLKEVAKAPVGKPVPLKVLREGKEKEFQLKPVERKEEKEGEAKKPSKKEEGKEQPSLGLQIEDIDRYPGLKEKFELADGVVVIGVEKDSPAEKAGIEKGDVITEVNREKIRNVSDFRAAISKAKKGEPYLFKIKNEMGGSSLVVIGAAIKVE
jgi:serine protease Do